MGVDGPEVLLTWYDGMRTRFGKLSSRKSGDGVKGLMNREKCIMGRFNFFNQHIARVLSRLGVSLKAKL